MLTLSDKTQSILYILLVMAGSAAVVALGWHQLLMFVPALTALVMMLVIGRDGYTRDGWRRLGLGRAGVRRWPAALLLPAAALGGGYLAATAAGAAAPEPLPGAPGAARALNYLLLVAFYTFTFSLGEEVGWRGYLLPRLMAFGHRRGHLICGLAWAAFHYPVIFLSDLYRPDGNRLLGAGLFTLMVLPLSVVIGELRLRTDSLWVASLMHSAHNAFDEVVGSQVRMTAPLGPYLAGETGIVTLLIYLAAALWLLHRSGRRTGRAARSAA